MTVIIQHYLPSEEGKRFYVATVNKKKKQTNKNNLYLYSCLVCVTYYKKILKIKLEYWLPGITIGASGARQPVDVSIK